MTFGEYVMFVEKKDSGKYDHLLTCELRGQYEKTNGCNIAELVRLHRKHYYDNIWLTYAKFLATVTAPLGFIACVGYMTTYIIKGDVKGVAIAFGTLLALAYWICLIYKSSYQELSLQDKTRLDDFNNSIPLLPWTAADRVKSERDFKESLVYLAHRILRSEENFEDLCGQPKRVQPIVSTGSDILKCKVDYLKLDEQAKKFGFFFAEGDIYKEASRR